MEEEKTKEHKSEESSQFDKKVNITEKIRQNPWILSTFILGVLIVILLIGNFSGMTGSIVNEEEAGEIAQEFLSDYFKASGITGEIILNNVKEISGMYYVDLSIDGESLAPVFISKDGKYLGQMNLIEPEEEIEKQQTQQPTTTEYSEEDLIKLSAFSSCLADNGVQIYGANWCGWTSKLVVDTLGGFDVAGDAYVECTEETELCESEGVTGYPTIKINGELYSDERTLEALGEATGCSVPELEGTGVTASSGDASC